MSRSSSTSRSTAGTRGLAPGRFAAGDRRFSRSSALLVVALYCARCDDLGPAHGEVQRSPVSISRRRTAGEGTFASEGRAGESARSSEGRAPCYSGIRSGRPGPRAVHDAGRTDVGREYRASYTIVFSDIEGFTPIRKQLSPESSVALGAYLEGDDRGDPRDRRHHRTSTPAAA